MSDNDNKDQPKDLGAILQDLMQQTERFLGSAQKQLSDSVQDTNTLSKQVESQTDAIRKLTEQNSDAFEKTFESFMNTRGQRAKDPIEFPKTPHSSNILDGFAQTALSVKGRLASGWSRLNEKLDEKMAADEKPLSDTKADIFSPSPVAGPQDSIQQTPPKSASKEKPDSTNFDENLLDKMSVLVQKMTGETPVLGSDSSWSKLDRLSALVRAGWVSVMSQGEAAKSSGHQWLNEWEKIVKDIHSQSEQWPAQHKQTWGEWSKNWLNEIEMLRPWFVVAVTNQVNPHTVLLVPTAFKGRGVITSPPKGTPENLVVNLQNCADFFEFHASKKSKFHWVNTPAKHAFEECQKEMNEWKPQTSAQETWKEKSLQRYSILEGRLTLLGVNSSPSPTGRKNTM